MAEWGTQRFTPPPFMASTPETDPWGWPPADANRRNQRIKGRRYKAKERADARWRRDWTIRCDCGRPERLDLDGRHVICPYGNCVQFTCSACGRISGGFGPVGCLCDSLPGGHGRYAEQRRPGVRKKYRDRRARPKHWSSTGEEKTDG